MDDKEPQTSVLLVISELGWFSSAVQTLLLAQVGSSGKGARSKAESLCTVALLVYTPGSVQETTTQVLLWHTVVHLGSG